MIKKIIKFVFSSLFKKIALNEKNIARNEQNIKALSRAVTLLYYTNNKPYEGIISKYPLFSKVCTQADMDSSWCAYWIAALKMKCIYHRKFWEYAYVAQALYNADMLQPGKKGIVFGCGREPLPALFASLGCKIIATDAPPEKGWKGTTQYADSLEMLYFEKIVNKETFKNNVQLEYVDMNNIPSNFEGQYDFCWSICALEHLGSLENGLVFVERSLDLLKKGGIAVHTTEYNISNEGDTISAGNSVLYQKKHIELFIQHLRSKGYVIEEPDFTLGNDAFDCFVDMPPYDYDGYEHGGPHIKLLLDGYTSTCFGIIISKP
jgi:SAM-dependent methyltransferase